MNDYNGVANENGAPVPTVFFQNAQGEWIGVCKQAQGEPAFDEQVKLAALPIEGVPYFIETRDGREFSGRAGPGGLLPRIETYGEDDYTISWGDEALARMTEGKQNG